MSRDVPVIRRIVCAGEALIQRPAEIEWLLRLAAQLDAELHALYVEDRSLHQLASLPFAREVRAATATTRSLGPGEIERSLRAQATRAEAALAAMATRRHVRWSFQVTRGQLAAQVRAVAMETDLVAWTTPGGGPAGVTPFAATIEMLMRGAPCPLLMLPPGAGIHPPFVVIYDGSPASARALRLALRLAQGEPAEVTVLLVARESSMQPRLRAEADAMLAGTKVSAQYRVLSGSNAATIARAVGTARVGTLFMAAESPVFSGEARSRLLEEIECAAFLNY